MAIDRTLLRAQRVLSALLLLLATACSGADEGATADPTPAPAPADASEAAGSAAAGSAAGGSSVTLITPGDQPRTELRYDLAAGERYKATMRQRQTLAQTVDGQSQPEVEVDLRFAIVTDVERDGDIYTARSSLRNGRAGKDLDPQVAAAVEASLAGLEDLTMVDTFDAHGAVIDREIEGLDTAGDDTGLLSTVESLQQTDVPSLPLPADPVGVGAQWSATADFDVQGIPMTQTSEYEVLEIDGDVVELAVTTEQAVPAGTQVGADQSAMGADVEVQAWDITGDATVELDLTHAFPTLEQQLEGSQELDVTVDGEMSAIEQEMSTDLKVRPN